MQFTIGMGFWLAWGTILAVWLAGALFVKQKARDALHGR
jgi:hypothetical protein